MTVIDGPCQRQLTVINGNRKSLPTVFDGNSSEQVAGKPIIVTPSLPGFKAENKNNKCLPATYLDHKIARQPGRHKSSRAETLCSKSYICVHDFRIGEGFWGPLK